jgi:hypothetical protein
MDAASIYVTVAYAVVFSACVAGAFAHSYDANLPQRIAMALFAIWSVWRVQLVVVYGWGYPHETFVATALLLYAVGSAWKTIKWTKRRQRARRVED